MSTPIPKENPFSKNPPDAQCYYNLVQHVIQQDHLIKQIVTDLIKKEFVMEVLLQEHHFSEKEITLLNDKYNAMEKIFLEKIEQNTKIINDLFLTVATLSDHLKSTRSSTKTIPAKLPTELTRTETLFSKEHFQEYQRSSHKRPREPEPENFRNVVCKREPNDHPTHAQTQNDKT